VLLDYRVRGRWLVEDLWAWVNAIHRRMNALVARILDPSTTPYEMDQLLWELQVLDREGMDATALVQELVAGASEDGAVEPWALTIGVATSRAAAVS
jgi:hypothetical protein